MLDTMLQEICAAAGWTMHGDRVRLPARDGRTQDIRLEPFREDNEDFVRVFSAIGPVRELDERRLTAALRLNASMRFGAFAIIGEELAVVDTFMIREADADELRQSMTYLASTADRYEQVIFGTDAH